MINPQQNQCREETNTSIFEMEKSKLFNLFLDFIVLSFPETKINRFFDALFSEGTLSITGFRKRKIHLKQRTKISIKIFKHLCKSISY